MVLVRNPPYANVIGIALKVSGWKNILDEQQIITDAGKLQCQYTPIVGTVRMVDAWKHYWVVEFWTTQGDYMVVIFYQEDCFQFSWIEWDDWMDGDCYAIKFIGDQEKLNQVLLETISARREN